MSFFKNDKNKFEDIKVNEFINDAMDENLRDAMFVFSHSSLVVAFYNAQVSFLKLLISFGDDALELVYGAQNDNGTYDNIYNDFNFTHKIYTNKDSDIIVKVLLPEPSRILMSRYVYLRYDKYGNPLRYYLIEKYLFDTTMLSSYSADGTRINHNVYYNSDIVVEFVEKEVDVKDIVYLDGEFSFITDNYCSKNDDGIDMINRLNNDAKNKESIHLDQIIYCRKCGFKLDEDVVYCRKCGNKVR